MKPCSLYNLVEVLLIINRAQKPLVRVQILVYNVAPPFFLSTSSTSSAVAVLQDCSQSVIQIHKSVISSPRLI